MIWDMRRPAKVADI